jgi:hypothetical protein
VPQFRVGHYCSAEVMGPEAIMTTVPEPSRHQAYGMRGDSISALLHNHFVAQRRLTSGTLAHLSVLGYAERTVWARSATPDGLSVAGEDTQGMEPSEQIQTPVLLPFAPISFVFCTCFPSKSLATISLHGC